MEGARMRAKKKEELQESTGNTAQGMCIPFSGLDEMQKSL